MALYIVVIPCVVGNLHYARVPDAPIEVDDAVAAPLVSSGALSPVDSEPAKTADGAPHRRHPAKER